MARVDKTIKKLAILTSGGDAPGMNTFIRSAVRKALDLNLEVYGIYEGYQGMLELVRQLALTIESPVWQAVRAPAPWKIKEAA